MALLCLIGMRLDGLDIVNFLLTHPQLRKTTTLRDKFVAMDSLILSKV